MRLGKFFAGVFGRAGFLGAMDFWATNFCQRMGFLGPRGFWRILYGRFLVPLHLGRNTLQQYSAK